VVTTLTDRNSRKVIGKESFRARDILFWGFDGEDLPYPPIEVEWLDGPDRVAVKFEGICLIVLLPSGETRDSRTWPDS